MVTIDGADPEPVEPLLALHLSQKQFAPMVACVRGFDFRSAEVEMPELSVQFDI